tara:strand:- start:974 stop:1393 length:420 start_codon:yes stop_codon:yes gene_type:complete
MALKQIGAREQKTSQAFKDISMAFGKNPFTDDANVVKNDNSIKQAVRNLILTTPGEKPFQPLCGSKVNALLFEPLDPFTADTLTEEIINTINQFEPRVSLKSVNVSPIWDLNQLSVRIEYKIVGKPIVESFTFVLQRPE